MSKRIGVTDHAIVRWLERHWDIPRKELVKKILRQEVTQAIEIGATSIKVDGLEYILNPEKRTVVTILK